MTSGPPWQQSPFVGWPPAGGAPPPEFVVSAGPNASRTYGVAAALAGSVTGGVPPYVTTWSIVSNPNGVVYSLADATSLTSNLTLSGVNGVVRLQLRGEDSVGHVRTSTVDITLSATLAQILAGITTVIDWDAHSLADGAVAHWLDTTATYDLAQATVGKQPTRSATALDGLPGVTNVGGKVLNAAFGAGLFAAGSHPYVFVVVKPTARTPGAIVNFTAGGGASHVELFSPGSGAGANKTGLERQDSSGGPTVNFGGYIRELPQVMGAGFTAGGTSSARDDNFERNSTRTGTPTADLVTLRLFDDDGSGTYSLPCIISEVVACSAVPDADQRDAVAAFLHTKWAIATMMARAELMDLSIVYPDVGNNPTVGGFGDVGTDGTNTYWVPLVAGGQVGGPQVLRHKNALGFRDATAWDKCALAGDGAFVGGGVFVAPYYYISNGHFIQRLDTRLPFVPASWSQVDTRGVTNSGSGFDYEYPFTDGRYIYWPQLDYFAGVAHGVRCLRQDTHKPFNAAAFVASPDTTLIGAFGAVGWNGGTVSVSDGRVFFVNGYSDPRTGFQIVWDPALGLFSDLAAWSAFDTSTLDPFFIGFNGAADPGDGFIYYSQGETINGSSNGLYMLRYQKSLLFTSPLAWSSFSHLSITDAVGGLDPVPRTNGAGVLMWPAENANLIYQWHTSDPFAAAASYDWLDAREDARNPFSGTGGCFTPDGAFYSAPDLQRFFAIKIHAP